MTDLVTALRDFNKDRKFSRKGPLCVALVITQHARKGLPLNPDELLTEAGGQVLGLGRGAVQAVLNRHGITRVLAAEGGRTSRGSISNMREYVAFLNGLAAGGADLVGHGLRRGDHPQQAAPGVAAGEPAQHPGLELQGAPGVLVVLEGGLVGGAAGEVGPGVGVEDAGGVGFVVGEADDARRERVGLRAHESAHMRRRL